MIKTVLSRWWYNFVCCGTITSSGYRYKRVKRKNTYYQRLRKFRAILFKSKECWLWSYTSKTNFTSIWKIQSLLRVIISKDQPWLCVSIDGVVVNNGSTTKVVEVKYPISCKKYPVINLDNSSCDNVSSISK